LCNRKVAIRRRIQLHIHNTDEHSQKN
jgi:hypothetical protein